MLKTQITGAKYLSPQTNQMTNLNIAVPADSKDTEFGTSDILLAKDTAALVADVKRTALEGEKTTIFAPTHVDSNIKFEKNVNLADGCLYIKINFDKLINLQYGDYAELMYIGNYNVTLEHEGVNGLLIHIYQHGDSHGGYYFSINDQQFETTIYKDGRIECVSDAEQRIVGKVDQQFELRGFNTIANKCTYTCEVFQHNFLDVKMSQLDNDCNYIRALKDGSLRTNKIIFGYGDDNMKQIKYNGLLCLPLDTVFVGDDNINYSLDVLFEYINNWNLYQIVSSLPTANFDPRCIYMIKKTDPADSSVRYDKYIYIIEDSTWEKIG